MLTLDIFDFMICNMQGALSTAVQKLMFFTSKLHSPHKTAARPWRTMMNLLRFVSKLGFAREKNPTQKLQQKLAEIFIANHAKPISFEGI